MFETNLLCLFFLGPREPDRIVDWRKLLSHPVEDLRKQNVILFSVSLEENPDRNDFVNLDLIAGDRARVFTLAKLNDLVGSLKRTAKLVCPGKMFTPIDLILMITIIIFIYIYSFIFTYKPMPLYSINYK